MEQHAVPQDITGFKFKLVGDMTLTQFGYLAGGSILAYLFFASKIIFFIKWPLVFLFGFAGVALAFLPFEERPLDRWIVSFIKAIYSPTQYLWKKQSVLPDFFKTNYLSAQTATQQIISTYSGDRQRLEDYLKTLPPSANSVLDAAEQRFYQKLNSLSSNQKVFVPPSASAPIINQPAAQAPKPVLQNKPAHQTAPSHSFAIMNGRVIKQSFNIPPAVHQLPLSPKEENKINHLDKLEYQNDALERQSANLKGEIDKLKQSAVFTIEDLNKLKDLGQNLADLEKQRNKAQEEISRLKQLLNKQSVQGVRPILESTPLPQTSRVKYVPQNQARQTGLPNPPQTPNIISGLVVDQKDEILPGTIVVIKDIYDNPVRAIKTNKLGQFSISTPLPNAIYNLELEKEGFNFDIIEIEVKGEIIPPLGIKAK